ncbi:hypothetical protein [Plantibacter sp. YIM 135347]|uniref:hypothetical protein n=1 Tax=Plantibacter sp. YIM 135347 TaxID=3423919 RepID=UPI003D3448CF
MTEDADFEALAARLTDPASPAKRSGEVLTGAAAAAAGRAMLLRDFGSDEALATAMRRGRPRVGDRSRGKSPTVRGRISDEDFAAFKQLEMKTGKKQSELIREAVHLLLARHRIES